MNQRRGNAARSTSGRNVDEFQFHLARNFRANPRSDARFRWRWWRQIWLNLFKLLRLGVSVRRRGFALNPRIAQNRHAPPPSSLLPPPMAFHSIFNAVMKSHCDLPSLLPLSLPPSFPPPSFPPSSTFCPLSDFLDLSVPPLARPCGERVKDAKNTSVIAHAQSVSQSVLSRPTSFPNNKRAGAGGRASFPFQIDIEGTKRDRGNLHSAARSLI